MLFISHTIINKSLDNNLTRGWHKKISTFKKIFTDKYDWIKKNG